MKQNSFKKFELPFQLEELSRKEGGLYFFSIRFPTDYELGLTTGTDRDMVLNNLARRLDKYAKVYSFCELKGSLVDSKAEHMKTRFDIAGKLVASTRPSELLKTLLNKDEPMIPLEEVTRAMRFAFSSEKPIYIGICHDQTFYDRILQHVAGYSGLLPFLKECQMNITDVSVHCLPLQVPERSRLRSYEQIIQAIFRPAFSLS